MAEISRIVRERLGHQPTGDHPDANLLSAFAERALTSFLRLRVGYSKMRPSTGPCTAALAGQPDYCDTAFAFSPTLLQDFRLTERNRTRWQIDLIADF